MIARRALLKAAPGCAAALVPAALSARPRTLDDMFAGIEQRFECRAGFPAYICQTGERYVTLTGGGIKPEGELRPKVFSSQSAAIAAFERELEKYAVGKGRRLYWRTKPQAIDWVYRTEPLAFLGYDIRARLIVTDEPELPPQVMRHRVWLDEDGGDGPVQVGPYRFADFAWSPGGDRWRRIVIRT